MKQERLRLGHITYSNCFPVHARLLDSPRADDPELVEGIPSELNALLETGSIDLAPCSSIEFARHADRYRVLPELVIGSLGPVRSITFLSAVEPRALDRRTVALPTASATSVVLLKILLRLRWGVRPRFTWFDQGTDDPFERGAAAALVIGDVALREERFADVPRRLDLGEAWTDQTGLPFAFAVWQCVNGSDAELRRLHRLLLESRAYGIEHRDALAERHAVRYGFPARVLAEYWSDLVFDLDARMEEGLRTFYSLAAQIGELETVPTLRWLD
jgi:chorismate dehydratase